MYTVPCVTDSKTMYVGLVVAAQKSGRVHMCQLAHGPTKCDLSLAPLYGELVPLNGRFGISVLVH